MQRKLAFLWEKPDAARKYRAAASLHGHTNHSKESLCFIAEYATPRPLLRFALAMQEKKAQTRAATTVDYRKGYWTPPLQPLAAFQLECDQIERVLGLASMISLTDHNNIEAPLSLRGARESRDIPVAVEWSVPYRDTTLHLGLHNLPQARAETIMAELAEYTKNPAPQRLQDLLHMMHENPDVLVVLNHPMWDLAGIGKERHMCSLSGFVTELGRFIHAFELGGWRSWEENQAVLHFAERWNRPVIAGGDRHCAEPSAVLNLTDAENFPEFVHEVRRKRRCHILFMPQYAKPFTLRLLQSVLDIVREYPDYPDGSRRWDQRVFHPDRQGIVRPLASLWRKPPRFIDLFFCALGMLEMVPIQKAVQIALALSSREKHFSPGTYQEVAPQWKKTFGLRSFPTHTTKSMVWRTPAASLRSSRRSGDSLS